LVGSDSLEKIKEVEFKASKIIEKAEEEKNRLITEAQKKALKFSEKYEEGMKKERELEIKKIQEEPSKKLERKVKKVKLKKGVENKMQKELNFLYKKFMGLVSSG
jgi:vacuolar-type H+-ATPase subunit H